MKPHRAVLVLVFGILGLVFCPFLGVSAWVMGNNDLREIAQGRMDPSGKDLTKAGRILGMIATVLIILWLIMVFLLMLSGLLFRG